MKPKTVSETKTRKMRPIWALKSDLAICEAIRKQFNGWPSEQKVLKAALEQGFKVLASLPHSELEALIKNA